MPAEEIEIVNEKPPTRMGWRFYFGSGI
jgi:hypothetical protein